MADERGPSETNQRGTPRPGFSDTGASYTEPPRPRQAPPPRCPDIGHPNACRCSKPELKLPEINPNIIDGYERERLQFKERGHQRPWIRGRREADAEVLDRLDSERWLQRTANQGDRGETRLAAAERRAAKAPGDGDEAQTTTITTNSSTVGDRDEDEELDRTVFGHNSHCYSIHLWDCLSNDEAPCSAARNKPRHAHEMLPPAVRMRTPYSGPVEPSIDSEARHNEEGAEFKPRMSGDSVTGPPM